jgi:hypothetical protein
LWQKLFVLFIIQAQPGGSINVAFIQEWLASLHHTVTGRGRLSETQIWMWLLQS